MAPMDKMTFEEFKKSLENQPFLPVAHDLVHQLRMYHGGHNHGVPLMLHLLQTAEILLERKHRKDATFGTIHEVIPSAPYYKKLYDLYTKDVIKP